MAITQDKKNLSAVCDRMTSHDARRIAVVVVAETRELKRDLFTLFAQTSDRGKRAMLTGLAADTQVANLSGDPIATRVNQACLFSSMIATGPRSGAGGSWVGGGNGGGGVLAWRGPSRGGFASGNLPSFAREEVIPSDSFRTVLIT